MGESDSNLDRFDLLSQRYLDGAITASEMRELNALLRDDESRRDRMVDLAMQAQLMHEALAPALMDDPALRFTPSAPPAASTWRTLAIAAGVALVASVATWLITAADDSQPIDRRVVVASTSAAVLTDTTNTVWDIDADAMTPTIGDELLGRLALRSGSAQLLTHSGAVLTLMGPAELEMIDPARCALRRGRLVVHCPKRAHGFTVQTPNAIVTDLGTEFGVSVGDAGVAEVHVFSGVVDVARRDGTATQRVRAGEAVTDRDVLAQVDLDPWRFDRAVPLDIDVLPVPDAYVDAVRSKRPASYWRFEQAAPMDNSIDGAPPLISTVTRSADAFDGALRFELGESHGFLYADGVFGGGRLSDTTRGDYTLEVWVRPDRSAQMGLISLLLPEMNARSQWQHLSLLELQGQGRGEVKPNADPLAIRFLHRDPPGSGGGTDVFSGAPYQLNRWNHIVGVRRGEVMELYLNGGRVWSLQIADGPVDLSPFRVLIGRAHPTDTPYRDVVGRIDELAIYAHALTDNQIKQHYRLIAGASRDSHGGIRDKQ